MYYLIPLLIFTVFVVLMLIKILRG